MTPDEFPDPGCDATPTPARAESRERPRPFAPPRWHAVSAVVDAALELPAERRAAYVAHACAEDAELRAEVEQLLRACERAERSDRFLAEPAGAFAEPVIADLDARVAAAETRGPAAIAAALSGQYTVERELGRGGTATVYLARDTTHGRLVAVKVLRPGLATALGPERFLREIAVAAGLTHPNILPLVDSGAGARVGGHGGGLLYYVMPYVDGESLRDRLRREKQLPVSDTLQIARDVAAALDHAHRNDIVHRDVKPENILLEGGRAMVADFGLALAISAAGGDRLTETGVALGTPPYMSPEQATAEPRIDGRSDVYSLACVVYEMLAGEPPFTGSSARAVIVKRLVAPPPQLSLVRDTVPAAADRVLARALERVPAARFATAGEFVATLSGAVGQA
jgi:eukaryotic-like serine/threonine-protein kinase